MIVNLAAHTAFDVDSTVSGTVALTRAQLQGLVDGDYVTDVATLSGTDILTLDVDLGNRVAVEDLRYYFDSATASGTVASGIQWLYKNYDSNPWYPLTTTFGGGYYTTTAVSGTFYPQYVRMTHTVSGTGIVGTIREYEVNNNDDIVDYGTDGTQTAYYFAEAPYGDSDPVTVPIYNDGQTSATAFVYIGNTDTDADDMLKLCATENGTYVSIDDNLSIDGSNDLDKIPWSAGSLSNVEEVNDKLQLSDVTTISYSSGWSQLATTLDLDTRPATIAWHPTDPFQSIIFYINDNTMYKYDLYTGVHLSTGATPRYVDSSNYGGANDLCYDPVGNRLYYYAWDHSNKDELYIYYYNLDTGLWTFVRGPDDHGSSTRYHGVALEYFEYPGTSDSLDGRFTVGERYIIATFSSGQSTTFSHIRLRLSDHHYQSLPTSGFQKETGDCASYPSCYNQAHGTAIQYENLTNFPTATVAVIWSIAGSGDAYSYLNYYPITVSGGVSQNWSSIKHQNLPRDPNIDSWYYNDDFTNRSHFFWYEDETDKLVMTSSYNNDVYAIEYQVQNNLLWRRYLTGDKNFFDIALDYGWVFGRSKYYDGYGRFWFMFDGYDEEIWMYYPTSWTRTTYETSGTYTTPVLKYGSPTYWRVKTEIPENTDIATSADAVSPTIEIRSSDTAPTGEDSHRVLAMTRDGNQYDPMGLDYDGNVLWQDTSQDTYTYYSYQLGCTMAINEWYPEAYNSGNTYAFFGWNNRRTGGYFNRLRMRLYNVDGTGIYSRTRFSHTDDSNYYRITNAVFAKNGMIYATYRGIGTEYDRLDILDSTLYWNYTLEFTGDQSTLYNMCIGGTDMEDLWLIKEDENEIRRYNQTLQLEQTVTNQTFGNLNGICQDGDGGFFVGETQAASRKFRHYDVSGTFVATYDVSDHVNSIHRMSKDYSGGVWILDTVGEQIARFTGEGILIGKTTLLSPQGLSSTPDGCWVMSEVYDRHYFISLDVVVEKNTGTTGATIISYDGDNWEGADAVSIDTDGYLDTDYISGSDPVWGPSGTAEWQEVGKDLNFVPYKTYHQARVTLRGDAVDTPTIEKIQLPPSVPLYNIGKQSSKNVYMKTSIVQGTSDDLRQTKIRTWFSVEE